MILSRCTSSESAGSREPERTNPSSETLTVRPAACQLTCRSGATSNQGRRRFCRWVLPTGRRYRTPTLVAVEIGDPGDALFLSASGVDGCAEAVEEVSKVGPKASAGIPRRRAHYARSTWPNCRSTPSSASSSAICWTNSAHGLGRSSIRGQRMTSRPTSSCVRMRAFEHRLLGGSGRTFGSDPRSCQVSRDLERPVRVGVALSFRAGSTSVWPAPIDNPWSGWDNNF
jgi:hypothetical protein